MTATTYYPCPVYRWWTSWIVEPDFGQERFMTADPTVLFREGNFTRANIIIGITAHEFISPAGVVFKHFCIFYSERQKIYFSSIA